MDIPFSLAAAAVRELAMYERHRIDLTTWHALRGMIAPPPDTEFAAWRARLAAVEEGGKVLVILAEHELAARALDRRLTLPLLCAGPTLWRGQKLPLTEG